MKYKKRCCLVLIFVLAATLLCACGSSADRIEPQSRSYFEYFDTVSHVYSYAGDPKEQFAQRAEEVADILGRYHKLFDIYHEYSGMNNLCTVNKNAGGAPVAVDRELIDLLLYAKELYEMTGGEMNIAMGAVLKLWHDCRTAASQAPEKAAVPSRAALEAAALHTDMAAIEIDAAKGTVRICDPEASIDVGALGKGYAAERAAEYLESVGAEGYVLNVGGNVRIIGAKPDGSGWVTGLKDPMDKEGGLAIKLYLKDTACVTSGIYERYFTVDGVRYHHIIDPDTLYPADYFASLSVITKDSGMADALSTALFCMPYEDGCALIDRMEGVDAVWIFPDGEIRYTSGLEGCITNR